MKNKTYSLIALTVFCLASTCQSKPFESRRYEDVINDSRRSVCNGYENLYQGMLGKISQGVKIPDELMKSIVKSYAECQSKKTQSYSAIKDGKIKVGDTKEQAIKAGLRYADSINRSDFGDDNYQEQWVFNDPEKTYYVYFDNKDCITTIQY